jgi:2,4-dienoyl-CoA reductase-like NADH-dependent reductase (Old Yellow Enzyme family)
MPQQGLRDLTQNRTVIIPGRVNRIMNAIIPAAMARRLMARMLAKTVATAATIFRGTLIANVNMTAERGNRLIAEGLADMVAFARPYIANPDLVERLATGAPLAEIDWPTVYDSGRRGYSDYPTLRHAMA